MSKDSAVGVTDVFDGYFIVEDSTFYEDVEVNS
jgi:hypothetical protein